MGGGRGRCAGSKNGTLDEWDFSIRKKKYAWGAKIGKELLWANEGWGVVEEGVPVPTVVFSTHMTSVYEKKKYAERATSEPRRREGVAALWEDDNHAGEPWGDTYVHTLLPQVGA